MNKDELQKNMPEDKDTDENNNDKDTGVENIKAKLESAKEELKKRYSETVEKIKADTNEEEYNYFL